jgi:plastocyanin
VAGLKVIVALVGTTLVLTACGGSGNSNGGGDCNVKGAESGTAAATVKVISDPDTVGAYAPKAITINAGQSIEWDWQDQGNPHSVTADDGSFDSCLQNAGYKFVVTFTKPGTLNWYHCTIHAQMIGTISVT